MLRHPFGVVKPMELVNTLLDKTVWKQIGNYQAKNNMLLYNLKDRKLYKLKIKPEYIYGDDYYRKFSHNEFVLKEISIKTKRYVHFKPGELASIGLARAGNTIVPIEEVLGAEIKESKFYNKYISKTK